MRVLRVRHHVDEAQVGRGEGGRVDAPAKGHAPSPVVLPSMQSFAYTQACCSHGPGLGDLVVEGRVAEVVQNREAIERELAQPLRPAPRGLVDSIADNHRGMHRTFTRPGRRHVVGV